MTDKRKDPTNVNAYSVRLSSGLSFSERLSLHGYLRDHGVPAIQGRSLLLDSDWAHYVEVKPEDRTRARQLLKAWLAEQRSS